MIVFVKNENMIHSKLTEWCNTDSESELLSISREAIRRGKLYWTCIDFVNFDSKQIKLIQIPNKEEIEILISDLSAMSNSILFRYVGSIEAQRVKIIQTLNLLSKFHSNIVNRPKVIKFGLKKDYLLALQENNFPVIPTAIYSNGIKKEDLLKNVDTNKLHIIKPATGELGNSVMTLDDIDNEWMRSKETIVDGWIIQPFEESIWDGEVQLGFVGDKNVLTLRKLYTNRKQKLPNQKERNWERIEPSQAALGLSRDLKQFFENHLELGYIHCCRFDLIETTQGIKILECEIVNPGMGYFSLNADERKEISNIFLDVLEKI